MIEIERKFLVLNHEFKNQAQTSFQIAQGYLSTVPERTVRVRIKGDVGYLTIKGITNDSGMSRYEWEKQIDLTDAQHLLQLCEKEVISKTRHEIKVGKHTFEVDEFQGKNNGLIIAEIELESETEIFEKPDWLGQEVTNDKRYYNAYLSQNVYEEW